ncbi:MAG: histidine kinase [Myxococcota bacterium]
MSGERLEILPKGSASKPLLFREVLLLMILGPPVLAVLLHGDEGLVPVLRDTLANVFPFVGFGSAAWMILTKFTPRAEARLPVLTTNIAARTAYLVAAGVAMALLGTLIIGPLHNFIAHDKEMSLATFLGISVVLCVGLSLTLDFSFRARQRLFLAERVRDAEQRARVVAQLRALEARTQPHFLFNTLNTIASLIHDDPDLAERTVERTADMLRYVVDAPKRSLVPLSEELRLVSNYLGIQQARFGERLEWSIECADEPDDLWVPPMSLQPLVENAMHHAIARRRKDGRLRVQLSREHGELVCRVIDNGPDPSGKKRLSDSKGTGTSMKELRQRLTLIFGDLARLGGEVNDLGGFTATLRIPERSLP